MTSSQLSPLRYLTFEISDTCALAKLHPRCPVSDAGRYRYGRQDGSITDDFVMEFWRWARSHGFHGTLLWHMYNEPFPHRARIDALLKMMRAEEPTQQSHLWTSVQSATERKSEAGVDHVVWTDYSVVAPDQLDNRRASVVGEGDYAGAPRASTCGRSRDFELIIDNRGNWLRCCNDWRCEDSLGNALHDRDWEGLLRAYMRLKVITWSDRGTFEDLPRQCRACVTYNPMLHRTALPPPGKAGWS